MQDSSYHLDLGFTPINIQVNKTSALPARYFSPRILQLGASGKSTFQLNLREIENLSEKIAKLPEPVGYRGQTARNGVYRSEHIGPPIHIAWHDWSTCELTGPNLGFVVWAYYIKIMLTLLAARRTWLHLKAACLEINGKGILVAGMGKTTLSIILSQSLADFYFVSNTHVLVDDSGIAKGVHSNVRLRPDAHQIFSNSEQVHWAQQQIQEQFYVSPELLYGAERLKLQTPLRAIFHRVNVDEEEVTVKRIDALSYRTFWHRFVYALAVYDLEEELLVDFLQRDCRMYEQIVARDLAAFDQLLATVPVYQIRGDLHKKKNQIRFLAYVEDELH